MTEDILDAPEQAPVPYKIFSPRAALWGTFLGGPLALGYMLAHNYKAFGQNHKIGPSWAFVIGGYLALTFLPELIPILKIASLSQSMLIALGGLYAVSHLQKEGVNSHLAQGGKFHPWQVTLLVGVVGMVAATVIALIVLALFFPEMVNEITSYFSN